MFLKFTLVSMAIFSSLLYVTSSSASNDVEKDPIETKRTVPQKVSSEVNVAADKVSKEADRFAKKVDEKAPVVEKKAKAEYKKTEKKVKKKLKKWKKKI